MVPSVSAEVHMYGLMAEHSNDDIVVWNGEHGGFAAAKKIGPPEMGHMDHDGHTKTQPCPI